MNTYSGNGSPLALTGGASNNFGVGLVGTSKDNLVERNKIGGNLNGVYIASSTQGGNVIRRNLIAGNPPAQISMEFGAGIGADIRNLSTPGANIFEDNRCLTYLGAGPSPCPNIGKPEDEEDREQREVAAFGRNRLVFPQARLVNAVFHPSRRLPADAGSANPGQTVASESVTVTGKVVDAACFMLHAPAATPHLTRTAARPAWPVVSLSRLRPTMALSTSPPMAINGSRVC